MNFALRCYWTALGLVLGALLALPVRAAEGPAALLTVLEGEATLVVGARALVAATGLRLAPGTLVETDAKAGFLRLEFPDGSLLDLGPGTRVALRPPLAAGLRTPQAYVLQGWVKQTQPQAGPAGGQLAAAVELQPYKGVMVTQVDGGGTVVFVESGSAPVQSRKGGAVLPLREGEAVVATPDGAVQFSKRPPTGWLGRIPRPFRDTLPARAAAFKGPAPQAKPRGPLTYAQLQPWLSAEAALRQDFPKRFAELLADAAFRDAVDKHLAQHPEWEALLRPPGAQAAARKTPKPSTQEAPR